MARCQTELLNLFWIHVTVDTKQMEKIRQQGKRLVVNNIILINIINEQIVESKNKPVWKRDLSTSAGIATAQLKIPAIPPANSTLGMLSSLWLRGRGGENNGFNCSEVFNKTEGWIYCKERTNIHLFPGGVRTFFNHS